MEKANEVLKFECKSSDIDSFYYRDKDNPLQQKILEIQQNVQEIQGNSNPLNTLANNKHIIDLACGSKCFYFDKDDERVLFCDKRKEILNHFNQKINKNTLIEINPDLVCDFTNLPFKNESFSLVIFDPPHIHRGSKKSFMVKRYGLLPKDYKSYLEKGFNEAFRILKSNGTLIFKWSESHIKLNEILALAKQKPLLAQKSSRTSHFVVFYKQ